MAKASLARHDWATAAESYRNVLTLYPDDTEAYHTAHFAYHDKLFAYTSAFDLSNNWLERHPHDMSAQVNFAELHVVTGRYAEAERRFSDLVAKPNLDANSKSGVLILGIMNAVALKKAAIIPQKLQELKAFISVQPETFRVSWTFVGTKHYVQTEPVFAPHRDWLNKLFSIVDAKDRSALLSALDQVQASFRP